MRMNGKVLWDSNDRTGNGYIIVFEGKLKKQFRFTSLDWIGAVGKQGDSVSFEATGNCAKKIIVILIT